MMETEILNIIRQALKSAIATKNFQAQQNLLSWEKHFSNRLAKKKTASIYLGD